jgi:hypothetical protein
MTISSETEEHRISGHGVEEVFVRLNLNGVSTGFTEAYDPTDDPNTGTAGKRRVDGDLLGVSVVGANEKASVEYDFINNQLVEHGVFSGSRLKVTLRIVARPSP